MTARILLFIALLLPWLSLFFVRKETIKRYMPVVILIALIMTIVFQIAYTYDWWTIHEYIVPWGYMIDISFAYGLYTVGTLWIFILTDHKFSYYVLANLVLDAFLCFVGLKWLEMLGIASFQIKMWQYFLIVFGISFILYGYQKWQEDIFKE